MPQLTDYTTAEAVVDTDVLFMVVDPEGTPASRKVSRGTFLGDTLTGLEDEGLANIPLLDAQNVFTATPNVFSSETSCLVAIRGKGASGAQNDSASFQLQKTDDTLNERFLCTRYFGHSSRNSETWLDNRIGGSVVSAVVLGNGFVNIGSAEFQVGNTKVIDTDRIICCRSYTVAGAPSAATKGAGSVIYVSNGAAGSPVLAFSDGTNWLRCDTLAAISSS